MRTLLALACSLLCLGCGGVDWEERAQNQYENGMVALQGRNPAQAREFFEAALQHNPYHPGANLALAQCLDTRYQDEAAALAYYERFLTLPDQSTADVAIAKAAINRLTPIRKGEMEDPADAVADLLAAARAGAKASFVEAMHPAGIAHVAMQGSSPAAFAKRLTAWRQAEVVNRAFVRHNAEMWAVLILKTPDGPQQFTMRPHPEYEGAWLLGGVQPLTP